MDYAASCDAVLLGPGLGRSAESDALVCDLVEALPQPLILDADGINAVSSHIDSLKQRGRRVTILTPHDVEFARLGGDLEHQDRAAAARSFALEHGCILVLKGHRTIVASPDGRVAVNTTGNSGMAKGGSGDVLSGMLLALLGQGMEPYEAACAAAYLHGRAGDLAARDLGEHGMTPSDMIQRIPAAIMELI
jgi:NAD(P)H-hydrate epimerase